MPSRKATPAPRRPVVARPCKQCGTIFKPPNNGGAGKFCSRECQASSQRKRLERVCEVCAATFVLLPSEVLAGRKHCGRKCMGVARTEAASTIPTREDLVQLYTVEGLSDRQIGERYGIPYSRIFKARKFYGIGSRPGNGRERKPGARPSRPKWGCKAKGEHNCRNCGATAVHLHHIVPRSRSRRGRDDMECNGMALCFRCHRGFHDRRITIYRHRLKPQELAFAEAEAGVVWVENNYPYTPGEVKRREHLGVADWGYCAPVALGEAMDALLAEEIEVYAPPLRD